MKRNITLIISILFSSTYLLAQAKNQVNPMRQFTILAVVSSVLIVGLWLAFWLKRKKQ